MSDMKHPGSVGADTGAVTQQAGSRFVSPEDSPRRRKPVVDTRTGLVMTPHDCEDRVWQANLAGYSEGLRVGEWDGYSRGWQDGKAAAEAAEAAEWAACAAKVRSLAGDHGLMERRGEQPGVVAREREGRGWAPLAGGANPGWPA